MERQINEVREMTHEELIEYARLRKRWVDSQISKIGYHGPISTTGLNEFEKNRLDELQLKFDRGE